MSLNFYLNWEGSLSNHGKRSKYTFLSSSDANINIEIRGEEGGGILKVRHSNKWFSLIDVDVVTVGGGGGGITCVKISLFFPSKCLLLQSTSVF